MDVPEQVVVPEVVVVVVDVPSRGCSLAWPLRPPPPPWEAAVPFLGVIYDKMMDPQEA